MLWILLTALAVYLGVGFYCASLLSRDERGGAPTAILVVLVLTWPAIFFIKSD